MLFFDQPPPAIIVPAPKEIIRPGDQSFVSPDVLANVVGVVRKKRGVTLGTKIDGSGLTKFGNMTGVSGLAVSFDGSQTNNATSSHRNGTSGYVGITLASPERVFQLIAYGTNNLGFTDVPANVTVEFYAKAGAVPGSETDGTLLGTTGSIVDTTSGQTILASDKVTQWDHVWARNIPSVSGDIYFTELEFYRSVL